MTATCSEAVRGPQSQPQPWIPKKNHWGDFKIIPQQAGTGSLKSPLADSNVQPKRLSSVQTALVCNLGCIWDPLGSLSNPDANATPRDSEPLGLGCTWAGELLKAPQGI